MKVEGWKGERVFPAEKLGEHRGFIEKNNPSTAKAVLLPLHKGGIFLYLEKLTLERKLLI